MFSTYYQLTKPRVVYGNSLTVVAGFLLAAGHFKRFSIGLFLATIVGMTLIIAAACVLNNYFDQDIDRIMERTKDRAVASGQLAGWKAVTFSISLGVVSIAILALWVNWLVVGIAVAGFITYVWLYGVLTKRLSIHGTLVGSISGALPIVGGYCAVADRTDVAAVLLFLTLFFWQFPEFYSIAIYRRQEYKAAGIPVMPVVKGVKNTKFQIVRYISLFVVSSLLLTPFGFTGYSYLVVMAAVGVYWLWLAFKGLTAADSDAWARKLFHFSLVSLSVLCLMLSIGALLP